MFNPALASLTVGSGSYLHDDVHFSIEAGPDRSHGCSRKRTSDPDQSKTLLRNDQPGECAFQHPHGAV